MRRNHIGIDGYSISRIIKGNWQLSQGHSTHMTNPQVAMNDMMKFINAGITTFDFGDIYVGVEELIGKFLRQNPALRQRVQLHTKYVPDADMLAVHSFEHARATINRSRIRLQVDCLDLVQFHWWNYEQPGYVEAILSLQRLQKWGWIRLLGVTNFDIPHMEEFVHAGIIPTTLQIQYSVLDRRPENGMLDFCRENGIHVLCYGTVAGGFLSERYLDTPEPAPPFENRSLTKYKLIIDEFGGWELFQELLHVLHRVARKHSCSISCIASTYVLAKPQVAGVIIGARNTNHLADNLQTATLSLDADDHARIAEVLRRSRGPAGDIYQLERENPRHSGIMQKGNNAQ